ncbi:MAG TPA: prepilin-type N-terminal cleavage/methylation domain-containing protein [Victivallales bacterium]|nr:prepilin-type N-terminal cleavage/methylation domain-containing protein [Victivallales bacterium]
MNKPKSFILQKSFTLIELLVVIAIISIIASLLLPALKTAKEMAKGTVCLGILKQMGMANIIYADDNYGYCVPPGNWSSSKCMFNNSFFLDILGGAKSFTEGSNWSHAYWPSRLLCPSSKGPEHSTQKGYFLAPASWGINCYSMHPNYYVRIKDILKFTGRDSSRVIFLDHISLEAYPSTADPNRYFTYGEYGKHPNDSVDGCKRVAYRHIRSANVAFYDGHAAPMKWDALYGDSQLNEKVWRQR